ncbi:MAG: hypothetical protein WCI92_09340 [Bacteroidota bacterium]
MKIRVTVLLFLSMLASGAFAQETEVKKCDLSIGADFASMYLWRGIALGTAPAVQPWGEFSYKGLTLGAWGSYEFTGETKEIDLSAKYTRKDFSVLFFDMFFPDSPGLNQDYFNYNTHTTGHLSELAVSYNGSDKIPFSVYGGVILYGIPIDHQVSDTSSMNYSSYFEVNYLGKFKDFSYNVFAGFTPTESYLYETEKFSFINVGLSAEKAIKITSDFEIPIKLTLSTNPASKKIFMALIISI